MSLNFVALGQQGNTRTFTATTGGNTTLTVDAANWDKVKIGDIINSAGVAAGTYVIAKPSGTTLTISAAATSSASETVTIMPNYTSSAVTLKGADLQSGIYAHDA
jgi:putative sterol carrier protein